MYLQQQQIIIQGIYFRWTFKLTFITLLLLFLILASFFWKNQHYKEAQYKFQQLTPQRLLISQLKPKLSLNSHPISCTRCFTLFSSIFNPKKYSSLIFSFLIFLASSIGSISTGWLSSMSDFFFFFLSFFGDFAEFLLPKK